MTDRHWDSEESVDHPGTTNSHSFRVGVYDGWPVHIGVSQSPRSAPSPDHFAVNLFVVNPDGENVDIARIDTAHAGCHIDRFFLPRSHPERREDYSVQYATPTQAIAHSLRNDTWAYYAHRYHEAHGLPEKTRVYD